MKQAAKFSLIVITGLLICFAGRIAVWMTTPIDGDAAASYNPKAGDPCSINMRISAPINAAAGAQIITGSAGKQTYICGLHFVTATAQNIALVEGTGAVCATNTAGIAGGATAATGWNLGVNGFMRVIGSGQNWVLVTATAGDNVCLLLSSTGQTSGTVVYVQQ